MFGLNLFLISSDNFLKEYRIVEDIDDLYGYFELNIIDEGILFDIETIFVFVLKYSFKLYVGCFAENFVKKLLANGCLPRFKKNLFIII